MIRMSEKSELDEPNAAPSANEIASCVRSETLMSATHWSTVAVQLDVDPVAPQPALEVGHVPVEGAVAAASGLVRKVGVDAVGGRLGLIDDDRAGRDDADGHRSREEEKHDRDRQAAWDPRPWTPRTSGLSRNAITDAVRKRKIA